MPWKINGMRIVALLLLTEFVLSPLVVAQTTAPASSIDQTRIDAAMQRARERQQARENVAKQSELEQLRSENDNLKREIERLRAELQQVHAGSAVALPGGAALIKPLKSLGLNFENEAIELVVEDIRFDLMRSAKQLRDDLNALREKARGVRAEDEFGEHKAGPESYRLFVSLRIRNKDARRIFHFTSYRRLGSGADAMNVGNVELHDDVQNEVSNLTPTADEEGTVAFADVKPLSSILLNHVFDLPPKGAKFFTLKVDKGAVTFNGDSMLKDDVVFKVTPDQFRRAE
jgi:hypothetical protein